MVAAMQQQMNNIQSMMQSPQAQPQTPLPTPSYGGKPTYSGGKKDYSRSPPPTSYQSQSASSPYPSAAPTPSRSVYPRQTGRTCTYPSNGQGLPADAGATEWNQELWKRARARFYPINPYRKVCRPSGGEQGPRVLPSL
eukprot:scaffold16555_cov130-Isochrysis_galbana.AAC.6